MNFEEEIGGDVAGNFERVTLIPVLSTQQKIVAWYRSNGGHSSLKAAVDRAIDECLELGFAANREEIREEMAGVTMCLMTAAEIVGFDLEAAILEKLAINEQRKWTVDSDGCLHHVKGSDPRE